MSNLNSLIPKVLMCCRSHKGKDRGDKYKDSFSEGLKRDDKSSSDSE